MSDPQENIFAHREALFDHLAKTVIANIEQHIEERGYASLVLSGGSTPKPLFSLLAGSDLPWHKVVITLADERWVPESDDRSNGRMIRETLLTGKASAARFIPLYTGQDSPSLGEKACAASLAQVPRPFTAVLLGMGTDGHTASLFPDGNNLTRALDQDAPPCLAIHAPGASEPRITLSFPVLCDTEHLILLCTGDEKRAVFEKARETGPVEAMPIRAFLRPSAPSIHFFWAP